MTFLFLSPYIFYQKEGQLYAIFEDEIMKTSETKCRLNTGEVIIFSEWETVHIPLVIRANTQSLQEKNL